MSVKLIVSEHHPFDIFLWLLVSIFDNFFFISVAYEQGGTPSNSCGLHVNVFYILELLFIINYEQVDKSVTNFYELIWSYGEERYPYAISGLLKSYYSFMAL